MSTSTYAASAEMQAEHYDRIAQGYALHYGDTYSQAYRDQFINSRLFEGIDIKGLTVMEAMCGSGETTAYLLNRGAEVIGLDVSPTEIEKFKNRWPDAEGICSSIFETEFAEESLDCVVVVGGLHHLHPHLSDAIREMHRVLKKGGYLCFSEPHKGSFFDTLRQFWYRHDDLFAANEEAVDVESMKVEFKDMFEQKPEIYSGNVAYLFVLNSMVFRIPIGLKKLYSPLFLRIEKFIEKFQGPRISCMTVGQWKKI